MRLILVGTEYSGTTTLARGVFEWVNRTMDGGMLLFHDHWKIPLTSGHQEHDLTLALDEDEQAQVMAMSPKLKEMYNRYSLYYHVNPGSFNGPHFLAVGLHIEEAVFGPLYFGYGRTGLPWPEVQRSVVQDLIQHQLLEFAPDMVLGLVKASPDVIARRMRDNPHRPQVVPEKDIELVSKRFEEEYERSAFANKLVLDTSEDTVEETMAGFVQQIEPFLSDADKMLILVKKAKDRGDWL